MKWIIVAFVLVADIGAYFSVPKPIRADNQWALVPGGGFCLFSAYHFGDKIKAPNVQDHRPCAPLAQGPRGSQS